MKLSHPKAAAPGADAAVLLWCRTEAACAKGDLPPDSPRSVTSGLLSESSSQPDSPRHAVGDNVSDVIHAEVAASWPSTERCHRGLPDSQLLAIEEALSDQPNDPVMRLARVAHRLCVGDMHAAVRVPSCAPSFCDCIGHYHSHLLPVRNLQSAWCWRQCEPRWLLQTAVLRTDCPAEAGHRHSARLPTRSTADTLLAPKRCTLLAPKR